MQYCTFRLKDSLLINQILSIYLGVGVVGYLELNPNLDLLILFWVWVLG